jgi:hypothetical protein
MPFDPNEAAAEFLREEQKPTSSFDPEAAAEELLTGKAKAAQEFFEADFDPENTAGPLLRLYLARGDNLQEKQKRLKKSYPDGDLKFMPESLVLGFDEDTLVWRENKQSQWKLIEPEGFDWMDIPEAIAPSAESIAAETAIAIGTGGGSVPATVGRQVVAAFAGEALEQAGQSITGTQAQTIPEILLEPTLEGGYSAIGGFAASPFVAIGNIAKGRGALRVGDEGLETIRAAEAIDPNLAKGLTPALVSDNPALILSERQSAALLPGMKRRYRALVDLLDKSMRGQVNRQDLSKAITSVHAGLAAYSNSFLKKVSAPFGPMSKGGKALQEGLQEYDAAATANIKGLYEAARAIEEPQFNMTPMLDLAADLRKGSKGKIDASVDAVINDIAAIKGPLELSDGRYLSVTDQLRNARTQLFALKHVKPGEVANQTTGQASDLYRAINKTIKEPENVSVEFLEAWAKANDSASTRFKVLEQAPIIAIAKSQNPADLVRTYAVPGQVDNLLAIRSTVSKKHWDDFTGSFYADLVSDPSRASSRLAAFDQETIDVLIPKADQKVWDSVVTELKRISSVSADDIAETQVNNKHFIDGLISGANPRKAKVLLKASGRAKDSQMRQSLRAGILEWAWDGIVKKERSGLSINKDALADNIKTLKRSGMWRLLSESDKKIIGNAEIVSRAFNAVVDAGTSIQAASAVHGVKSLEATAIKTFIQNELVAQFYLSSMGRKMLIGSGLPNSNGQMLRLFAGALTQISVPEDVSKLDD